MKIVAKDAEEMLPDVVLGDDEGAGDFIIDPPPLPSEKRKVQITELFRAANPFAWGRGNRATSFRWTVSRNHASDDIAGAFARRHAAQVPINVVLTVSEGAFTDVYTGVIPEVTVGERLGRETVFGYAIEGAVLQPAETDGGGAPGGAAEATDPS